MINDSERQNIQSSTNDNPGGQIETKEYSQLNSEQPGQRKIEFAPPHPEVKLTENAYKILKKRYLKKGENGEPAETPEQLFWRVARNVAEADRFYDFNADVLSSAKEFYHVMASLEFLPNSPTLMNAGRELQQLSACFVLPVGDSMEEIFTAVHNTAIIQKTGGGTGFSFSRLRPKGDMVKSTDGVASGPLSFIEVFNATTESVRQGGRRRGANMGILRVDHPDIIEFITAKRQPGRLTNFNISVALTNEFMRALENDEEYDLINPRNGEHVKKLKASTVFDMIIQNAWETGEPGIIFIDRIDEDNPTPSLCHIESTNPCVTGDSLIPTDKGLVSMSALARDSKKSSTKVAVDPRMLPQFIYGGHPTLTQPTESAILSMPAGVWRTGVKETIRIKTKCGYEVVVTPDHKIMTPDGWKPAGKLKPGVDQVLIQCGQVKFNGDRKLPFSVLNVIRGKNGRIYKFSMPQYWDRELGQIIGLVTGDGWVILSDKESRVGISFGHDQKQLMHYAKEICDRYYGYKIKVANRNNSSYQLSYHSKFFAQYFVNLGLKQEKAENKCVPSSIFTAPKDAIVGFLQGLFTSDGTMAIAKNGTCYVRLTSKSRKLLDGTQMLLILFGIKSRIYARHRPKRLGFEYNGKNGRKQYLLDGKLYELQISRDCLSRFMKEIGFLPMMHRKKIEKLKGHEFYKTHFEDSVAQISPAGIREVYDLTEPITHSFICNGIVVSNCGEQPLLPYESCVLGSINLGRMVKKSEEDKIEIDQDRLRKVVHLGVHFLDNVIDMNRYPIKEIEETTKANRKIGLGIMGFADLLIQMGIPYDSKEAVETAQELMKFIQNESILASQEIAKTRGAFPNFSQSIYNVPGAPRIRNATCTTIAPTGTISMIAGCSSGIEPLFAVAYVKTVMDKDRLIEVNPRFVKAAKERNFYSEELMEKVAEKGNLREIAEVPDDVKRLFVTAHEITPEWHIRMQAAFQKYIHNSISKTINFPHDATQDDVRHTYMLAWKLGCKGVTVYRDGSREGVISVGTKEKEEPDTVLKRPRPRPSVISGKTIRMSTGCGNLYVTINEDENGPFELFTQMGKSGGCAASQSEAISRLISLALRSGIDPQVIIQQLQGIRCPSPRFTKEGVVLSCADAVSKALHAYFEMKKKEAGKQQKQGLKNNAPLREMTPGERATLGNAAQCPECGTSLYFQEGCLVCPACGYSRCE